MALHSLPPPLDDVHGPGAPHVAVITQSGELKLVRIDQGKKREDATGVIVFAGAKLRVVGTYLLTEGTFKYAFPEGEAGVEAASDDNAGHRLGACVAWRDPRDAAAVTAAYRAEAPSDWWAPVAVAVASRTGSLCFLRLGPSNSGDGGGGAELVRTVHPHLPRDGARDARIHDAALWEAGAGCVQSAAVVTVGGDGVVAVTHFDQTHSDHDAAWRCVDGRTSRATRVAVCERYATAVTGSVDEDDVHVWDLRAAAGSKGQVVRRREGEGFDRATYRLRGLAIGGSGRLVGVSNTNRVGDATMQLVRGDRRLRCVVVPPTVKVKNAQQSDAFSSVCCKSIGTNHRPEWIRTSQGTRAPDGLDIDDGRGGHPPPPEELNRVRLPRVGPSNPPGSRRRPDRCPESS